MEIDTPAEGIEQTFTSWASGAEPRVRAALTASFGSQVGADAAAAAMAIAWERWDDVRQMSNPIGYVFGIGRNTGRRLCRRHRPALMPVPPSLQPDVEPGLPAAIAALPERQRIAVTLVHGYGWTLSEAASLMGIAKSTVQNHVERGLLRLREQLGVT